MAREGWLTFREKIFPGKMKRCASFFGYLFLYLAVLAIVGEGYMRLRDFEPLGVPGSNYQEHIEECRQSSRLSLPTVRSQKGYKHVLVQGCSFTYGQGVAESETFCWQLNQMQNRYIFHNHGMIGLGVCSALLDLPWQLDRRKYDLVLYAAIGNHVHREVNICSMFDNAPPALVQEGLNSFACNLEVPLYLNGEMHSMRMFWARYAWPWEKQLRLMSCLHRLWFYAYSSPLHDPLSEYNLDETRFCRGVRACYTICKQRHIPFAVVQLYGFNRDRLVFVPDDWSSSSLEDLLARPLTPIDVVPDIPIIDAEYPQYYMAHPELHTKPTPDDPHGDHPTPLVHKYYAEKIWAGVQEICARSSIVE